MGNSNTFEYFTTLHFMESDAEKSDVWISRSLSSNEDELTSQFSLTLITVIEVVHSLLNITTYLQLNLFY